MKTLKVIALALFVIMALIFIGCGGAGAGVAGGTVDTGLYNND